MKQSVKYLLLAEAFAVLTFGVGWWTVPVIAALWGFFSRDAHRASLAAIAAALGWLSLLILDFARGPVGEMASQLGEVMGVPAVALYVLTLAFPAALAWSAAAVVPAFRRSQEAG